MAGGSSIGLPESLVSDGGKATVSAAKALEGKDYVALYFSASWCGPCHAFTPKLVEYYKKHAADKKFEVVFVSLDRDAKSFGEYFSSMPWKAIPFDSETRRALPGTYKVEGIPTLLLVDAKTGEMVTEDMRPGVEEDPGAAGFPYKPRGVWEVLETAVAAGAIKAADGSMVDLETLKSKDLGLLFSASWCPPCRAFEPILKEWYHSEGKAKGVELLFLSSDRSEADHDGYRKEMPWLALDFDAGETKAELSRIFKVRGIPSLVFINPEGKTLVEDGRTGISTDPKGYPWPPKAVEDAQRALGGINDGPVAILFTDKLTAPQDESADAFRAVAQEVFDGKGFPKGAMTFTTLGAEDAFAGRLRGFLGISGDAEGDDAIRAVVSFIPKGVSYRMAAKPGPFTTDEFRKFIAGVLDGSRAATPLG